MNGSRTLFVVEPVNDRGGLAAELRAEGVAVESTTDAADLVSANAPVIVVDFATPGLTPAAVLDALSRNARRPMVLIVSDDLGALHGSLDPQVVHGCLSRRSTDPALPELVLDCLEIAREASTADQARTSADTSATRSRA